MTTQIQTNQEVDKHRLLGTKETSEFLGMSAHWVKASRHKPELDGPPFLKIGRTVKYDTLDLEEWLNRRKFRGTYEYASSKQGGAS